VIIDKVFAGLRPEAPIHRYDEKEKRATENAERDAIAHGHALLADFATDVRLTGHAVLLRYRPGPATALRAVARFSACSC